MLLNNLDPEVAERPEELIVYGGSGKAARNHDALAASSASLLALGEDETLARAERQAGRGLPHASGSTTRPDRELAARPAVGDLGGVPAARGLGLTMFGQMTAGSWIYIGTQGILQGTYQTFAAAGEKHFGPPTWREGRS